MPDYYEGLYYDRDGIPLRSVEEWGRLLSDLAYIRVARTKVTDAAVPAVSFDVSTLWLGVDHGFGDGPPLIFETMVFAEGSSEDGYHIAARYPTEAQARDCHNAMVIYVASKLTDPIVMDVEPRGGNHDGRV